MTTPALQSVAAEARAFLFERAGPLWSTAGQRDNGLFVELLGPDGPPNTVQRLRVQARQIYSLCELGRLGWTGEWRPPVERGLDALFRHGRRADGFFVHKLNTDGSVADDRADLYDHAFVLFALVNAADALRRPELMEEGGRLMDLLEERWSHPSGGFYEGEVDPQPPRRQNPHMHMTECSIAYWRAGAPPRWEAQARRLAALSRAEWIDAGTGAITELFHDDWSRTPTLDGDHVEPGHCLEWTWLQETLAALGVDGAQASDGLAAFARAHGIDPERNVAFNETGLDGAPRDRNARLWPQTERMKAALARWRRTGDAAEEREALSAYAGLKLYLDAPGPGLWRDKMNEDGSFVQEPSPASSFYHIACGLSELIHTADGAAA